MWLSWLKSCMIRQNVAGSVPAQGTYPGFRFDPQSWCVGEATDLFFFLTSIFLSLSLPFSLSKTNKKHVLESGVFLSS